MGEIRKTVGENIKKVCQLKGIRQVDISEHMKVSQGTVSNWFKGTNSIDIENLAELCSFLGVSLDQIFGVAPLTPEVTLSQEETDLLSMFRALNSQGKDMLMSTARAFAGNPDMQKESTKSKMA
ncbi:MAG: helix-turn-helix transcriptional regulator [Clostridia bacterium]|nr:helix-turn-helix transcriptional regulator [Clostridia bacterium]